MTHYPSTIISIKAVSQALKTLIYSPVQPSSSPLYDLALVDNFLTMTDLPSFLRKRQFAFEKIMIDLLTRHFRYLSCLFHISPPPLDEPYEQMVETIAKYALTNNPELIGWCWLYHYYVRSELHILPVLFSDICHIDERTLRRYKNYALKRLLDILIEEEWQMRWKQNRTKA